MPKLISLFSGAAGLDLGLEAAGFRVQLCVENDAHCLLTLEANRPEWRIARPSDIFKLKPIDMIQQAGLRPRELDLLAGGPPCQPFSKAGYWHRGEALRLKDPRAKTLNAYTKIVEMFLPKAILLENVEGINFNKKNEGLLLLKRHLKKINQRQGTNYQPVVFTLNAADFGVPQIRKRVFLVASREGHSFSPPMPTHGDLGTPYVTAWDAIGDLEKVKSAEDLTPRGSWTELLSSIPQGKNYLWHTDRGGGRPMFGFRTRFWSFLLKLSPEKPSWTISAQPGPSTGPFHWNNRLLSIRELARLQTFPNGYNFVGSRQAVHKQIGNAVPPLLAEVIGRAISNQLLGTTGCRSPLRFEVPIRRKVSRDLPIGIVPEKYVAYEGVYAPHPGTGKGPGAVERKKAAQAHDNQHGVSI